MLLKFLFLTSCILFIYTPSFHSQLLNNDQQKEVENGLIILKVKKSKNEIEENNNFTEIHQRLFSHQNNSFTTDELDVVLEIDHLEADSKKLKRHRIINDLNQTHTNFIERIKDNNDKRKYIYIINKQSKNF